MPPESRLWKLSLRPLLTTIIAVLLPGVGIALLVWQGAWVSEQLEALPVWQSIALVVLTGALLAGTALLPTHAVSLAAGYLLGAVLGPITAWVAVMGASGIGYFAGQFLAGRALSKQLSNHPKLSGVYHALVDASPGRTTWLVGLIRLSPLAPFAGTNAALVSVGVGFGPFMLGSAWGLAPRIAVVAWLGSGMSALQWTSPSTPWLFGVGIAATLIALIVIGRVAQQALTAYAAPAVD